MRSTELNSNANKGSEGWNRSDIDEPRKNQKKQNKKTKSEKTKN